jgi:methionyl aminopeptidase
MAIGIKSLDQFREMRKAGLVVYEGLEAVRAAIEPGVTTSHLNEIAVKVLKKKNAKSNFLNYHGYPAVICSSVNEEIVHTIPNQRKLELGDVLSIDFGAIVNGWHGDSAITVAVGEAKSPTEAKLISVCEESMWRGIAAGKVGGRLTDISHAIESYINSQGTYGILREYGGHGIGQAMHEDPHILNFGPANQGPLLEIGMAFAIEPMITLGTHKTKTLADDWTVVSTDGSRGAHFEHTFALLPDGKPFVLTAPDGGREKLASLGVEVSDLLD